MDMMDNKRYVGGDKRFYKVVEKMSNHQDAANALSKLNMSNLMLIKYMVKKYKGTVYEESTNRLHRKYNPDTLSEHIPIGPKNTSYVVNKGESIKFCLRPNTNRDIVHDIDILTFVSLHEISHIMNKTNGHKTDFWQTFKFILHNAAELGIYKPVDYVKYPKLYCNLIVNYNPLFDAGIKYPTS